MKSYIEHDNNDLWVVAAGDARLRDAKADATTPGVAIDRESSPGPDETWVKKRMSSW